MKDKFPTEEIKIVLTGGHAGATAMSTIQEINGRGRNYLIYWIGPKYAIEGKKIFTYEYRTFPEMGVNFVPIISGRLQRKFTRYTILSFFKIPFGFVHAFILLSKIKPEIIVSFGGFASFPVVAIAKLLGIPVIIHEQTTVAGLANRFASFFADKIVLARKESQPFFPAHKSVVIGNPISKKILSSKMRLNGNIKKTILITGGSRGAKSINEVIKKILPEILKKYIVIHQTGFVDEVDFKKIKKELSRKLSKSYSVYPFINPRKWPEVLNCADILISRAGANIVSEIIAAKKPSILIPLPFSYLDEQKKNALFAQKFGLVFILDQENISPKNLLTMIEKLMLRKDEIGKKEIDSPDINADKRFVDLIEDFL